MILFPQVGKGSLLGDPFSLLSATRKRVATILGDPFLCFVTFSLWGYYVIFTPIKSLFLDSSQSEGRLLRRLLRSLRLRRCPALMLPPRGRGWPAAARWRLQALHSFPPLGRVATR